MTRRAIAAVLLGAFVAGAAPLAAQTTTRTLSVSRQLADSQPFTVRVDFSAGQLQVGTASPGRMFEMDARYAPQGARVLHTWGAGDSRVLRLALDQASLDFGDDSDERRTSEFKVGLTNAATLDLAVDVGAAAAELELGGLRLARLQIESGASQTRVRFDTPNPVPMAMLEVSAGAADLSMRGLANANASEVSVTTGVGSVTLDFGGEWRRDMQLRLDVKVGSVRLRVPRDVGIRVERRGLFARLQHDGMIEKDGAWETPGWETATRKLVVRAETWLGKVRVERQ